MLTHLCGFAYDKNKTNQVVFDVYFNLMCGTNTERNHERKLVLQSWLCVLVKNTPIPSFLNRDGDSGPHQQTVVSLVQALTNQILIHGSTPKALERKNELKKLVGKKSFYWKVQNHNPMISVI